MKANDSEPYGQGKPCQKSAFVTTKSPSDALGS